MATQTIDTHEYGTIMPTLLLSFLESVNCKFGVIVECMEATIDLIRSKRVTGLDPPIDPSDAVNKAYVDTHSGSPGGSDTDVQFNDGGVFGGSSDFTWDNLFNILTVNGKITGLLTPTDPTDATNKAYVDSLIGSPATPFNSIQFNNGGLFGGTVDLLWNNVSKLFTTTGRIIVNNTTQSTNPTNGSITTTGGLGVALDGNFGGNVYGNRFISTSDATLKENIIPLNDSLSKVRQIECYKYNFINDDKLDYGLLAQQLEDVGLNDLVDNTRGYKGVNYLNLISMLIDSIKELDRRVARTHYEIIEESKLEENIEIILDSLKQKKLNEINTIINTRFNEVIKKELRKNLNFIVASFDTLSENLIEKYSNEIDNINDELEEINKNINEENKMLHKLDKNIEHMEDKSSNIIKNIEKSSNKLDNLNDRTDELYNELIDEFNKKIRETIISYESDIVFKGEEMKKKIFRKRLSKH